MPQFLLQHQHTPDECEITFASWQGFQSPLRGSRVPSSCLAGRHELWWEVEAPDADEALRLLPRFVAERTTIVPIREVELP